ncbi:MAG: cyclase family protein [bacterium]
MISREIDLGGTIFRVIDLTHPLRLDQEVYPGDSRPQRKVFSDIQTDGWQYYLHELGDHHFQPHGDAPNHFVAGHQQAGFEKFGLDYAFHSAFLIDLSASVKTIVEDDIRFHVEITASDLVPYSQLLAEKGAVLLRTGYDRWLEANLPHDPQKIPYLTEDAATLLASFPNLKVVGTDSITVDRHGDNIAHNLLVNMLIVECMVHLHEIPNERALYFDLQTSAIRIVGATGGPVLAYAFCRV